MGCYSLLIFLASGNHGGSLVFAIGVGVMLLIAIYLFAKGAAGARTPPRPTAP